MAFGAIRKVFVNFAKMRVVALKRVSHFWKTRLLEDFAIFGCCEALLLRAPAGSQSISLTVRGICVFRGVMNDVPNSVT